MPPTANASRFFARVTLRESIAFGIAGVSTAIAITLAVERMQTVTDKDQDWTGELVATPAAAAPQPSLSSASLVVPKSMLTLPPEPAKPIVRIRSSCDSADKLCVVRQNVTALPPKRPIETQVIQPLAPSRVAANEPKKNSPQQRSLNPLDHLPDLSGVGRPFSAAGRAVTSWIKWY